MKVMYNPRYNLVGILVSKTLIQLDESNMFMVISKEWLEIGKF